MKELLPPHIGWPLFVVALLASGVATTLGTLFAARSDGGAQVIDDYYRKAAEWDAHAADLAASATLGWQVRVAVVPDEAGRPLLELTVRDRDGQPVTGLTGTVRAFRPQWAEAVGEAPLAEVTAPPGVYRQPLPLEGRGLWDFEIEATRGPDRFHQILRKELP
ncbi:MAG: hypothetical protein KatS3mg042_1249 [Rhodothermaceae bacterium]|nr:MAG: hypothetical protein KatS3mg042_1249 [Rhodothermaceae bacterium]